MAKMCAADKTERKRQIKLLALECAKYKFVVLNDTTVLFFRFKGESQVRVTWAICSPKDEFKRKMGELQALYRYNAGTHLPIKGGSVYGAAMDFSDCGAVYIGE